MMDEVNWDMVLIGFGMMCLSVASILTSRVLKAHQDAIIAHDEDISMIKAVLKTMDAQGAQ